MNASPAVAWHEWNQRLLMQEIERVRTALEARLREPAPASEARGPRARVGKMRAAASAASMQPPPAIEQVRVAFNLSAFERDVLLLCAGTELDSSFAQLVASAAASARGAPTFGLALAALDDPHWSALTPDAPLRRYRLLHVSEGLALSRAALRIDERVLHYLAGVSYSDMHGAVRPVPVRGSAPGARDRIIHDVSRALLSDGAVVVLRGEDRELVRSVAASACAKIGLELHAIDAVSLPTQPHELDAFMRLWEREAILGASALIVECRSKEALTAAQEWALCVLLNSLQTCVLTTIAIADLQRRVVGVSVARASALERHALWVDALGSAAGEVGEQLESIGAHFDLDAGSIRAACAEALKSDESDLGTALWTACRARARPEIDGLIEPIVARATWNDLVLPEDRVETLRKIGVHVRHRLKVYEKWGFSRKSARDLGITALFAGPSGTGKTMAAEVLANELRLDLYRIDLSQVISKYIGETEKNLRRVFEAADRACAILLFDEADALFGKRGEVKDSHDRYANVEVSYLLQQMEAYRGLAILTTNMQSALDTAFLRRLRFVVQFPFPAAAERERIWQATFPEQTPTENLDFAALARLQVTGGNIRSICINAAFMAAGEAVPVRMEHVQRAAVAEYAKLDRMMTPLEAGMSS